MFFLFFFVLLKRDVLCFACDMALYKCGLIEWLIENFVHFKLLWPAKKEKKVTDIEYKEKTVDCSECESDCDGE